MTSGFFNEVLSAALLGAVERHLREFSSQALAITVWALAAVSVVDGLLFSLLARKAKWHVQQFEATAAQHPSTFNALWAGENVSSVWLEIGQFGKWPKIPQLSNLKII